MKSFFKRIYLFIFQFLYFFLGIFIRQDNNTILFIQDFRFTLDYIDKRHTHTLYKKLYIKEKMGMLSQIKKILQSKYIYIDNYNVFLGYIPKKNKKIIQVWHGAIAIKKIGLDSNESKYKGTGNKKRFQRVYNATDFYICASEHMKEIFMSSFNQPEDKMLVYGYPKLDLYIDPFFRKTVETIRIQNEYLLDRLNILYIPTFRDNIEDNEKQVEIINKLYDDFQNEYNILYKLHQNVKLKKENIKGKAILDEELEKMIEIADIVITDYSSLVLEAIMQKKAVIYHLYDFNKYEENRGLNFDIHILPGKFTYDYEQLRDVIKNRQFTQLKINDMPTKFIPPNLEGESHMITAKIIKMVLSL